MLVLAYKRRLRVAAIMAAAALCLGWSAATTRSIAWHAVQFFPPDLAHQVRKHHRRYDEGIRRGLAAPPAWRAGPPGLLAPAFVDQVTRCAKDLRRPVPLQQLVEELGVLAVRVLDANDPLAVSHLDDREPSYGRAYEEYVNSILDRLRIVYYSQGRGVSLGGGEVDRLVTTAMERSRNLYPLIGEEFYRTGRLRSWRALDDRSVTFGVAGVALSHGMTDLANLAAAIWHSGGGLVPTPQPTPPGHVGPTITVGLSGGFPERERPKQGQPALPKSRIQLPPP
jgi:hypothetical protein